MGQPNPTQVQKYLSGVDYPCDREGLVDHARSQGADESVINVLENLPDVSYDGPDEVSQASNQA